MDYQRLQTSFQKGFHETTIAIVHIDLLRIFLVSLVCCDLTEAKLRSFEYDFP